MATTSQPSYLFLLAFNLLTLLTAGFVLLISAFLYLPYVKLILFARCSPASLKRPQPCVCWVFVSLLFNEGPSQQCLISVSNWKTYGIIISIFQLIAEVNVLWLLRC